MTVQVGEIFDLHRFLFSAKGGLYMPEQSVYHQKETDADQQTICLKIKGEGGFDTATVHGVMGGAWLAPNLDEMLANEETKTVLMKTVRMLDTHEEIIGLSGHLLAVSRKIIK